MKKVILLVLFASIGLAPVKSIAKTSNDQVVETRRALTNKYKLNEQQNIVLRPALEAYFNDPDKTSAEKRFAEFFTKVTGKQFTGF